MSNESHKEVIGEIVAEVPEYVGNGIQCIMQTVQSASVQELMDANAAAKTLYDNNFLGESGRHFCLVVFHLMRQVGKLAEGWREDSERGNRHPVVH